MDARTAVGDHHDARDYGHHHSSNETRPSSSFGERDIATFVGEKIFAAGGGLQLKGVVSPSFIHLHSGTSSAGQIDGFELPYWNDGTLKRIDKQNNDSRDQADYEVALSSWFNPTDVSV